MPQYRKRPVVVEAVQFFDTKEGMAEIMRFVPLAAVYGDTRYGWYLSIKTLEGYMKAVPGDWVIRGIKGEYYPCKPDIFAATYELVEKQDEKMPKM